MNLITCNCGKLKIIQIFLTIFKQMCQNCLRYHVRKSWTVRWRSPARVPLFKTPTRTRIANNNSQPSEGPVALAPQTLMQLMTQAPCCLCLWPLVLLYPSSSASVNCDGPTCCCVLALGCYIASQRPRFVPQRPALLEVFWEHVCRCSSSNVYI